MISEKHLELIAAVVSEFVGNGNAPQVEEYVQEAGWSVEELDEALKALGEEVGRDMAWL